MKRLRYPNYPYNLMKDISGKNLIDEITPLPVFKKRRAFVKKALKLGLLSSAAAASAKVVAAGKACEPPSLKPLDNNELTLEKHALHYNNYYEFSTNKEAVHILAQGLTTSPWTMNIEGEIARQEQLDITTLIKNIPLENRTYRFRCVEGWSMVIPWQGFPLCALLEKLDINSSAKFIAFKGLYRPEEMINQRSYNFLWPYTEGLRMDEAMHALSFIATGMYGKPLSKQNGAPIRIVMPWKYGFKSIKAIQSIALTKKPITSSWMKSAPAEYGFYANVNPDVSHPRWSQRREVRLGDIRKQKTLMFNGYEDLVADLYSGMDLATYF